MGGWEKLSGRPTASSRQAEQRNEKNVHRRLSGLFLEFWAVFLSKNEGSAMVTRVIVINYYYLLFIIINPRHHTWPGEHTFGREIPSNYQQCLITSKPFPSFLCFTYSKMHEADRNTLDRLSVQSTALRHEKYCKQTRKILHTNTKNSLLPTNTKLLHTNTAEICTIKAILLTLRWSYNDHKQRHCHWLRSHTL